jgi:hypothetical protein
MAQQVIEASTRTPGRNRGRGFHPPNDSRVGAGANRKREDIPLRKVCFHARNHSPDRLRHGLDVFAAVRNGGPFRQSTGSQTTPDESESTNNGSDLTRPQNALEMRFSDETSSNDTSETNRARMLLQATSKISFNADWRLAVLAQVPLVAKATTTLDPISVDHDLVSAMPRSRRSSRARSTSVGPLALARAS